MSSMENRSSKDRHLESQIYEHQQHLKLNSSELGDLWSNYMGDSMYTCIFEHFLEVVEDEEIKEIILFSQGIAKRHLATISELFIKEDIPVPAAFGSSDVNKGAPRLFDDIFMLFYIQQMATGGYGQYTRALTTSVRQDVMDYFQQGIRELNEIFERSTHLLLEKGRVMKAPKIPYPKKVEYVDKESFSSFMIGRSRPLASIEIKYLHVNILSNTLGKSLMMGFSQVATLKRLRRFFQDGRDLADKQVQQFSKLLTSDNIPAPTLMDPHVTDSQIPPYSDKLMLYHVTLANQLGMENLGMSMSRTLRHDIHAKYGKFIGEIGVHSNQGQHTMIKHGWFEQPPLALDRDKIVRNPI